MLQKRKKSQKAITKCIFSEVNHEQVNKYVISQIKRKIQPLYIKPMRKIKTQNQSQCQNFGLSNEIITQRFNSINSLRRSEEGGEIARKKRSVRLKIKQQGNKQRDIFIRKNEKTASIIQNYERYCHRKQYIINKAKQQLQEQKRKTIFSWLNRSDKDYQHQDHQNIFQWITNINPQYHDLKDEQKVTNIIYKQMRSKFNSKKLEETEYSKDKSKENGKQKNKLEKRLMRKIKSYDHFQQSKQILNNISKLHINLSPKRKIRLQNYQIDEVDEQFKQGLVEEIYSVERIKQRKKLIENRRKRDFKF